MNYNEANEKILEFFNTFNPIDMYDSDDGLYRIVKVFPKEKSEWKHILLKIKKEEKNGKN